MKVSAGVLLYRRRGGEVEVFLVHPGGPFFANKDDGVWSIPKGLIEEGEDRLTTALREFEEETSLPRPTGEPIDLGTVIQKNKKTVHCWAIEGDADVARFRSNTCEIEWPPRSGRKIEIPEVDRAGWFTIEEARVKMVEAQGEFLERLLARGRK